MTNVITLTGGKRNDSAAAIGRGGSNNSVSFQPGDTFMFSTKVAKGLGITETWLLGLQWRNGGQFIKRVLVIMEWMRIWIVMMMKMVGERNIAKPAC